MDILEYQTIFLGVLPIGACTSVLQSTINPCLFKDIRCIGKSCNFVHFYMLRKLLNLRTFFNPESWHLDKNKLFPCLKLAKKSYRFRAQNHPFDPFYNNCYYHRQFTTRQHFLECLTHSLYNLLISTILVFF